MRLPDHVHQANVAGLEPKPARAVQRAMPDNAPTPEFIAQRIRELEGDLGAQEDLFEALPLQLQDQVWALFRA